MKQIRLRMGPPIWVVAQGASWALIGAVVMAAIFSGTSYGDTGGARKKARRIEPTQSRAVAGTDAEARPTPKGTSQQAFYVALTRDDDKDDKKDEVKQDDKSDLKKDKTNLTQEEKDSIKDPIQLNKINETQVRALCKRMGESADKKGQDLNDRAKWGKLTYKDKTVTVVVAKGSKKDSDEDTVKNRLREVLRQTGVKDSNGKALKDKDADDAIDNWLDSRTIVVEAEKDEQPTPPKNGDDDKKKTPCPPDPCGPIIIIDPCGGPGHTETIVIGSYAPSYDPCYSGTSYAPSYSHAPSYSYAAPSYDTGTSYPCSSYSYAPSYSYSAAPSYSYASVDYGSGAYVRSMPASAPQYVTVEPMYTTGSYSYAPTYSAPVTSYSYAPTYSAPATYSYVPAYSYSPR